MATSVSLVAWTTFFRFFFFLFFAFSFEEKLSEGDDVVYSTRQFRKKKKKRGEKE